MLQNGLNRRVIKLVKNILPEAFIFVVDILFFGGLDQRFKVAS